MKGIRCYDKDGFKIRAACVCVRNENENEVLLISSRRHADCWIVPGGGIEDNENAKDAAEREVYEEAGVQGNIRRLLGIYENFDNMQRTTVYLLVVNREFEDWEESKKIGRKRKWFKLEDAISELKKNKPVQSLYLTQLKGFQK